MSFLVAGIIEVAKWIGDEAVTIGVVVWNVIKIIGGALLDVAGVIGKAFTKVWGYFGKFWGSVLKPFVQWSWREIVKLHEWLKSTFAPLLKFLKAVRTEILEIYAKWLKPIFDTIDAIRATLRLLADFHVAFAAKLDAKLAALEARLLQPIRFALEKVNEVIGWVDQIIDEGGLFQRVTLIESQWRYVGDLWAVLLKHQPAGISAADNARRKGETVALVTAEQLAAAQFDFYETGGGELGPAITATVAAGGALTVGTE